MRIVLLFLFVALTAFADLQSVLNEPNLERRSDKALANADAILNEARKQYQAQDTKGFESSLKEVHESVELSYKSLKDSGKVARKSPKYFKRAEMKLRGISKRLDNLEKDLLIDERSQVSALKKRVDELSDQIVLDIMTKR
jgi:hypothetical protein